MKVIAVNGKILLANGKAVKPTEVKADNFVGTTCEVAGNNNVSSNWSPSVTAVEYIPKKYSYNGVVLPEIPAGMLAQYPYCWIRNDGANSKYNLVFSKTPWYYTGTNLSKGTSENIPYYSISFSGHENAETWGTAEYSSYEFGLASNRTVLWSNHDIPNGSATATEIYFNGSEPVLAE